MFDEPIKIGLIRFADAYDHYSYYAKNAGNQLAVESPLAHNASGRIESGSPGFPARPASPATPPSSENERRHAKAMHDFDSSHQPLLVIYTNAVEIEAARADR